MTIDVAIILLTVNQRAKTLRCLESLQAIDIPTHRTVLWDNGSSDGTLDAVRDKFPDVLVHQHPHNAGVASGRNGAARLAVSEWGPRYLFFLDNDMTVESDVLSELIKPFLNQGTVGQTTGKIRDLNDPQRLYGAGGCRLRFWRGNTMHVGHGELDRGQYDRAKHCLPSGGCMLVRADLFQQLDGFDTLFDPYGPEDLDFGLRLRSRGFQAAYVPTAVVYHESHPGRTFESGAFSENYAATRARHWLLFMRRHAGVGQWLAFACIGAPYLFLRVLWREGTRGNWRALWGLIQGAFRFAVSRKTTPDSSRKAT